jgi:hypothetical protein
MQLRNDKSSDDPVGVGNAGQADPKRAVPLVLETLDGGLETAQVVWWCLY